MQHAFLIFSTFFTFDAPSFQKQKRTAEFVVLKKRYGIRKGEIPKTQFCAKSYLALYHIISPHFSGFISFYSFILEIYKVTKKDDQNRDRTDIFYAQFEPPSQERVLDVGRLFGFVDAPDPAYKDGDSQCAKDHRVIAGKDVHFVKEV